jgi:hypothetical protein
MNRGDRRGAERQQPPASGQRQSSMNIVKPTDRVLYGPSMVSQPITFSESRLLPALIAGFLFLMAGAFLISDLPVWVWMILVSGVVLAAIWPAYRAFFPRWVLRISGTKLHYHNLSSKQVLEFEASKITDVCIQRAAFAGSGADGGVGFQNRLVLQTLDKTWNLPLPFLSVKRTRLEQVIRERFSSKQ